MKKWNIDRIAFGQLSWIFVVATLAACDNAAKPVPVSILSTDEEAEAEFPPPTTSEVEPKADDEFISIGPDHRRTIGDTRPPQRGEPSDRIELREESDTPDGVSVEPRSTESKSGGQDLSESTCGDDTIATIVAQNGNEVSFCNVDNEAVMISELGKLDTPLWAGTRTVMPREFRCAADVFAAVAPSGTRIPEKLVELCEKRRGAPIHFAEERIMRQASDAHRRIGDETEESPPTYFAHFCSANGRSNFQQEKCDTSAVWNYDSNGYRQLVWCYSNLYSWHQLTMSTQLGTQGDHGFEVLASCQGSTDHGAGIFENVPFSGWVERVDAGFWHSWVLDYTGFGDRDMRFRGDGVGSNARHRFAGNYVDFSWP